MLSDTRALFVPEGGGFRPTKLAGSPWSAESLHGGPPAALLARAIERFESGGYFVARLTLELLRPVPFEVLSVACRYTRPGRKVQLVEASLHASDREVARATGLRIRDADLPVPAESHVPLASVPGPDESVETYGGGPQWFEGFHTHGVEHRFAKGSFAEIGPSIDWIRLRAPLLESEPTSPLCRVSAAADFGNGISHVLDAGYTYINPDLTIHLHRYPEGEWVCLDAVTRVNARGSGMAESLLRDERGPIGRAVQSLIVDRR